MKIQIVQSPLTGDEGEALQLDMDRIIADVTDACGSICFATGDLKDGSRYYAISRYGSNITEQEMSDRWKAWRDEQYGDDVEEKEKEDDYGPIPKPESWERLA